MKLKLKHIASLLMASLMLTATLGVGILSNFCNGCEFEYTSVTYWVDQSDLETCQCCANLEASCCGSEKHENDKSSNTGNFIYSKLNIDLLNAKVDLTIDLMPIILFTAINHGFSFFSTLNYNKLIHATSLRPPKSGRIILSLISVLRN